MGLRRYYESLLGMRGRGGYKRYHGSLSGGGGAIDDTMGLSQGCGERSVNDTMGFSQGVEAYKRYHAPSYEEGIIMEAIGVRIGWEGGGV